MTVKMFILQMGKKITRQIFIIPHIADVLFELLLWTYFKGWKKKLRALKLVHYIPHWV